eukprot:1318330-Amorphochlora_amoeboformis.AAC.1
MDRVGSFLSECGSGLALRFGRFLLVVKIVIAFLIRVTDRRYATFGVSGRGRGGLEGEDLGEWGG